MNCPLPSTRSIRYCIGTQKVDITIENAPESQIDLGAFSILIPHLINSNPTKNPCWVKAATVSQEK